MEEYDDDALTQFFASQPDFQDSTNLEGSPILFLSATSDRRFYWFMAQVMQQRGRVCILKMEVFRYLNEVVIRFRCDNCYFATGWASALRLRD